VVRGEESSNILRQYHWRRLEQHRVQNKRALLHK
jgi:hypothetical protein